MKSVPSVGLPRSTDGVFAMIGKAVQKSSQRERRGAVLGLIGHSDPFFYTRKGLATVPLIVWEV